LLLLLLLLLWHGSAAYPVEYGGPSCKIQAWPSQAEHAQLTLTVCHTKPTVESCEWVL
jgi:hypothetical protein